ncbi:rhomboid family intramembrane serine protease [Raphidocelis subcapitata]|uniref:Rhomboid family intramembrane serine protease n=1 Tax=Raphidocelis subcapitata TaxID=307507 RepID=A0A2V0NS64_9CHLO|nr:rhomboid family intramembrane serine protease [Raphidocelis subcapitata]|eukprot:GBF90508.1 rhomboid family intramembrane serine protease [Raphidocelis subcapitata]
MRTARVTGGAARLGPAAAALPRARCVPRAQQRDGSIPSSASSLDALDALGIGDGAASTSGQQREDDREIWWQARPRQSAPPRQGLMSKDAQAGRFINESVIGFAGSTRNGRTTDVGSELDIPQVEPLACYLVLAAQLAVYALGTWIGATQGVEASNEFALELALQPSAVLAAAPNCEWWRLGSCLLLHTGMPHLVLSSFGLSYLGPDAEALLGHGPFLSIYFLAGLTAAGTSLLFGPVDVATAGATGALMGIIGAMLGYELANKELRSHGELGRGSRRQIGSPWGAGALAGCALLLGVLPSTSVLSVDDAAALAGALAGAWLGYAVGPKFTVAREVDIPEGSMMVPQDAREVVVVLDTRGGAKKAAGVAAYGAALVGGIVVVGMLRTHLLGH